MIDVEYLESEWRHYKKSKNLRLILFISLLLFMFALAIAVWQYFSISRVDNLKPAIDTKQKNTENRDRNTSNPAKTITIQKHTIVQPTVEPIIRNDDREKVGKIIFQENTIVNENKKVSKRKKLNFKMVKKSKGSMVDDIEGRFTYSKEKSDAIFLAKYYYSKHKYKQARKWALEANKLDSKSEESWLIFAKTQAKLGKRVEALKILNSFIKQSGSKKAEKLIGKIRYGKGF